MMKTLTNIEVAKLLKAVAAAYVIKNENKFKIIAYEKAADSIEHATEEIKDLWEEGKLDKIPGIGKNIAAHLDELFKTGKVRHFEELMRGLPSAMFPLLSLPGFGPKKAYKLVKSLKLNDQNTVIDDLEMAAKKGKIAIIEGFGEKSEKEILEAILAFKKGQIREKRMNLPYADAIAQEIINFLKENQAVIRIDPLGSLRRRLATIGDIDIAVATKEPLVITEQFVSFPKKEKVIEKGPTGATLLLESGCQIDLRVQKPEAYGAMLQYFTGSKNHNIHLRELALKRGLSLSEYGIKLLKKNKDLIRQIIDKSKNYNPELNIYEFSSEEKFYEALGLSWIPPEIREDMGEIEAALDHSLPELIEAKDIRGDLHLHSNYPIEPSHDLGENTMEQMVEKAEELGYEYIAFSEHSPSITNHTSKEIYSILLKRKRKIEQIKLMSKSVRVINLLEVDILADGNLSIDEKSLSLLDGAIASVHSSFFQPREKMTKRILKALSNPYVRILGHPTGRMIGKREAYEVDWEKVFNFCKQHDKALEINSWPERLDLPDFLVRQAVNFGIKMVINTDAHCRGEMDLMSYGVSVARRGWAEKSDILNTLSYNNFYTWLRERR